MQYMFCRTHVVATVNNLYQFSSVEKNVSLLKESLSSNYHSEIHLHPSYVPVKEL